MNRRTMLGGLFAAFIPATWITKKQFPTTETKMEITSLQAAALPKFKVGDYVQSAVGVDRPGIILGVFHSSNGYGGKESYTDFYKGLIKNTYPNWNGGYIYHVAYNEPQPFTSLQTYENKFVYGVNNKDDIMELYNKLPKYAVYSCVEEDLTRV